jgi:hypothetical protein
MPPTTCQAHAAKVALVRDAIASQHRLKRRRGPAFVIGVTRMGQEIVEQLLHSGHAADHVRHESVRVVAEVVLQGADLAGQLTRNL